MAQARMHADEIDTDEELVGRLVAAEFPQWAGLPVTRVPSAGTDNAMYRLGAELVVRLPRRPGATEAVVKEQRWLPLLAPRLPLAVPEPLGTGAPSAEFPLPWSMLRWLDGADAVASPPDDPDLTAAQLAAFVTALRGIDATGGPHGFRSVPLIQRDAGVRADIAALDRRGMVDPAVATAAWESSLAADPWTGPPVWVHCDLLPGNLLVDRGRLVAVIDFGGLNAGDPAADLLPAWTSFSGAARDTFRDLAAPDEATWLRGRGWALCFGFGALAYYHRTNPVLAAVARTAIAEALADFTATGR
ncbi:aminoglycoside phosphotransferase family protein [Streptacidiphilus monticola]|uniref:Aminoglycoside phosphotransferase family protein n=1 Tax=Streptacidiphilus monticola TaxID=2161674 RepID=A0ABW1GCJ3_9ACTN